MDILKQLETELIKPYLDEWVTFDEATYETLDRAVLFSLDVSPSWILQDGSDYAKSYRILKHSEFARRLEAAKNNNLGDDCVFKASIANPERHLNPINLREFVRWATEQMKWDVPERFKGCAQAKTMPAAKVEAVAVTQPAPAAAIGELVAMTGIALLTIQAEAEEALQNSPYANSLLERFKGLRGHTSTKQNQIQTVKEAAPEAVTVTPPAPAAKGITKNAVIGAFEGLNYNAGQWKKLLGDQDRKWLLPARVARGDSNTSALWNPTTIALALLDKEIPIKKLDAVFVSLNDWADEWREKSAYFRD